MIDFTGNAKDGRVHDQKKKKKKGPFPVIFTSPHFTLWKSG